MGREVLILLHLRCGRVGEERNLAFVQYVEVIVASETVEDNLDCICVCQSPSFEMVTVFRGWR